MPTFAPPLPILARGRGWLVLDKPAGLDVAPGRTHRTSVASLLAQAGIAGMPVHRLDHDTSGCLAMALRRPMLRRLMAHFRERRVAKRYLALVEGVPEAVGGVVDAPLAKVSRAGGGWRMIAAPSGDRAITRWQRLWAGDGRALLAFEPVTGRTHQLRVHAGLIAGPILGDAVYGRPRRSGLMLHAHALGFPDPDVAEDPPWRMAVSPLPARMAALLPPDAVVDYLFRGGVADASMASIASAMRSASIR